MLVMFEFDVDNGTYGLWCEKCLLPSAAQMDVLSVTDDGINVVGRFDGCLKCERGIE